MAKEAKTLEEINREAIKLLFDHMGVKNTVRFLNQLTNGSGNYTEERREMFKNVTLDEIVEEIKKRRNTKG